MKILICTVAGLSTRFSQSIGREVLKCLYYKNSISETLLYNMIHQPVYFDKYIIVGGYKIDKLETFINSELEDYRGRIDLVYNEYYEKRGSGYSLYCGLKKALEYNVEQIVFAEGDLFFDSERFIDVYNARKSIVTVNGEAIEADKSVAFYISSNNVLKYIYDTSHNELSIEEPFLSIHNSGQVWKFADVKKVKECFAMLSEEDWKGTNLIFVEKYFSLLERNEYDIYKFTRWINCNTVYDYEKGIGKVQ